MNNDRSRAPFLSSKVVIDAGHGGQHTLGTSTPLGVCGPAGTLEKDVMLELARRVASHLQGRAVLTRNDDRNVSLGERAAIARRHGAPVFLSLHANGGAAAERRGAEAYVHVRAGKPSRALAGALQRRLSRFGGNSRGPACGELAILTPERLPGRAAACLLEVDYLSSRDGERRLRDPRVLDELARAIASGVDDYLDSPRYGDATGEPSEPRPADPADVAQRLLQHYLGPYLGRLSEEAKRRLLEAWREAPGGVIAAAAILGSAGIGYLVGTNSPLPSIPAIPLDTLGGVFQGAELQLRLNGPITSPESFQFMLTFRERPSPARRRESAPASEVIDDLLPRGVTPEQIATQIDGPEFETEVPGEGPESDIALYLGELVRSIANNLLLEMSRDPARPWLDLGQLPPLPGNFGRGLQRLIDALVQALPDRFGSIEQVSFVTHHGDQVRWIPVIPSARSAAAEPAATGQGHSRPVAGRGPSGGAARARFGDGVVALCALRVEFPQELPRVHHSDSPFRISNNHSTESRVLFDDDMVIFELENTAPQNVNCQVTISDDAGNGLLCQADIDVLDVGKGYLKFSRFPKQADQVSPMTSCRYEVTITNLDRHSEGVEMWLRIHT
jgi:N-acetylmuramoyl-L-alanine amidase